MNGASQQQKQAGFTLIELMMVVVIVAVLVAVALPAYQSQVMRGHRAAAKAAMLDIANRQEQYLLSNRVYTASTATLGYALPSEVAAYYTVALTTVSASSLPYYQITFTPFGNQAADGALTLDSEGVRAPAGKWER